MPRPKWMNDEEWQEYQMTEEYRQELLYVPDEDPYYGDYDDYDQDYADFIAEMEAEDEDWEEEEEYNSWYADDCYEDFHADG